jgi:hypothetical protein
MVIMWKKRKFEQGLKFPLPVRKGESLLEGGREGGKYGFRTKHLSLMVTENALSVLFVLGMSGSE